MATTTTFKLIRNQIVSVIEALTPATLNRPENKFRRLPDKTMKLDEWCLAHGNDGCFRKFDIRRTGGFGDPDILDPAALRRSFTATITVAYPDNADARESVAQYVDLMKMVYLRAAEGRADSMSSPHIPKATA